jgi:integrase
VVFYYRTYDEDGRRTVAHSTGETTRTAAVKKCNTLMREGKLLPKAQVRIPTFAEYAQGWWEPENCQYLKKRLARKPLTSSYEEHSRRVMEMFLVPYFGKMRLDRITGEDIDYRLVNFVERERRRLCKKIAPDSTGATLAPKKLKASYANVVFGVLRLMLKQAVKRHLIPFNPADNVEKLVAEPKQVEILTIAEFREMAKPKPKAPQGGAPLPAPSLEAQAEFDVKGFSLELAKMANFLAACTGMRIGEVLGLRGEFVFADFIRVQGQYGQSGYGPTKTRTSRNIPLTPAIMDGLRRLAEINGNGYLFSTDVRVGNGWPGKAGRLTPLSVFSVITALTGMSAKRWRGNSAKRNCLRSFHLRRKLHAITSKQSLPGNTGCGERGQRPLSGGSGRLIMTSTLTV